MAKQVIKSDGSKVPFDAKKITKGITKAFQDAKIIPEDTNKLVGEISNDVMVFTETKDKIKTSEIREMILSELDRLAPIVAIEWRKYMKAKKK